jgi:hypothetical protein
MDKSYVRGKGMDKRYGQGMYDCKAGAVLKRRSRWAPASNFTVSDFGVLSQGFRVEDSQGMCVGVRGWRADAEV